MSTISTPEPGKKINRIGLELAPYRGGKTTLCAGCGHNAISERIIDAFFEMGIDPKGVIKLSGIGCSSKSPAYFLGAAHGFNTVHGRMPSVGTGAVLANRKLLAIGVSGDGDTGAIGIGQFVHLMRRNVPIIYIIEDNGCYGLTKGQFSPTADIGSTTKGGTPNELQPIDTCSLAIELGAAFGARSFSGDKKQLLSILKAAMSHRGTCMIDVISPCVTFNDHEGSTKSYAYVKDHDCSSRSWPRTTIQPTREPPCGSCGRLPSARSTRPASFTSTRRSTISRPYSTLSMNPCRHCRSNASGRA